MYYMTQQITNPQGGGWYDSNGYSISHKYDVT